MKPEDYTFEGCPYCGKEVVIRAHGVTACPECEKPLVPCSLCSDGTKQLYDCSECPHGHVTCSSKDEFILITNPPITADEIAFALANC